MSDILHTVAELMALAARTAPKTVGKDFLVMEILDGEKVQELADTMCEFGRKTGRKVLEMNGENIRGSEAVLLIGLKNPQKAGINCGVCGASRCDELADPHPVAAFAGPICAWRMVDLGIAVGSAVKTASIHNVDNRVMLSIGTVACKAGLIDAEVALGIPLSATGKNIFFDRFDPVAGRK